MLHCYQLIINYHLLETVIISLKVQSYHIGILNCLRVLRFMEDLPANIHKLFVT